MTKRGTHEVAFAAAELAEARAGLERISLSKQHQAEVRDVLDQLAGAQARLAGQLPEHPGVPVSAAGEYLQVSQPTVRLWIDRGVLRPVMGAKPVLVDLDSLRRVGRMLGELRERGQDGDWVRDLVDRLHDAAVLGGGPARTGLDELRRGELEPA